jgi:signal transduction histidine kinase
VSVRRRLTRSSVLIALAAVLVLGVPLGAVEAARVQGDTTSRLEREADAVAGVVDDRLERGRPVTAAQLARLVRGGHRITVLTKAGAVTAGRRLDGDVVSARSGTSRAATVIAAAPRSEVRTRILRSWLLIAALALGGVGLAFALAAAQARRLSRPLEVVADGSARLGEGDFSVRVPDAGVAEIDAIAHALGRSAERIARLVGREREFSGNVSHQLRTPLTALRLRLEEAQRDADPAVVREEVAAAMHEADRLEATVSDLLAYARSESEGRRIAIDLAPLVARHVAAWAPVVAGAGRRLVLAGPAAAPTAAPVLVGASRGTVGQVLDVLLDNALRHGAGTIRVRVAAEPGWAAVVVEDEGAGVAAADRERIFDRGATGGDEGTGIGLHLARALAVADGGTLRLTRQVPARLELRLRVFAGS